MVYLCVTLLCALKCLELLFSNFKVIFQVVGLLGVGDGVFEVPVAMNYGALYYGGFLLIKLEGLAFGMGVVC